jgi:uncharacterized glyoxalase superfamily protein PhnB
MTSPTAQQSEAARAAHDRRPAPQVWPTLRASDARALIDFLVAAFGFEEVVSHPLEDGRGGIAHAQLAWPEGGGIMLGSVRDGPDDRWRVPAGGFGAYVVTDDPDAVHERAVAAGARVVGPPADTGYGSREFVALDPEGNRWSFGTYRGEPRCSGSPRDGS